jgi:hypothetical protein
MRHVLSVHQSGSGRHPTEGISFTPETFCDGFVLHGILARGLKFNPQASDVCQTKVEVFFDRGMGGQACGREGRFVVLENFAVVKHGLSPYARKHAPK